MNETEKKNVTVGFLFTKIIQKDKKQRKKNYIFYD